MRATSAPRSAADLAALTAPAWLSGTTPRPIAVARKGSPVASTSCRSAASACDRAAPLPTTSSGLHGMGLGLSTACSETNMQDAYAQSCLEASPQSCTTALPTATCLACTRGDRSSLKIQRCMLTDVAVGWRPPQQHSAERRLTVAQSAAGRPPARLRYCWPAAAAAAAAVEAAAVWPRPPAVQTGCRRVCRRTLPLVAPQVLPTMQRTQTWGRHAICRPARKHIHQISHCGLRFCCSHARRHVPCRRHPPRRRAE